MVKKTLWVLALLAAVVIVIVAVKVPGILHAANGYTAKWVCSQVFVGERPVDLAIDDLPANPLIDWLKIAVDRESSFASASISGAFGRRAQFRDGLGCTLLPPGLDIQDLSNVAPGSFQSIARSSGESGRVDNDNLEAGEPSRELPSREPSSEADPEPVSDSDSADSSRVLADAGVDRERLDQAIATAFDETDPNRPKNTRAVVVLRNGELAAERYAEGFSADSKLLGWSMTKSLLNALLGRAIALGHLAINDPADFAEWPANDPRQQISIDHLLRMSSGLQFNEDYADLSSDAVRMLFVAGDSGAVAANSELEGPPNSIWYYSSGTSNLLSRLLRDRLGAEAYERFPLEQLFAPLGMESALIEPDAEGVYVASSFGWATARDWAVFGQLYLQDGVWQGQRLLPKGWVAYTTTPAPRAPRGNYGAHFWLNRGTPEDPANRRWPQVPTDAYWASGFEGQIVVVVPSRRSVIVRLGLSQSRGAWRPGEFVARVLAALPD